MRIVTYNVNGLRARLSPTRNLAAFLDSLNGDIICFQETKISRQELTADIAVVEGYESFFSCTRTVKKGRVGYSGVATFCCVRKEPSSTAASLPLAADEGFTGLLHASRSGEIEGGKARVGCYEEVLSMEDLSRQELLCLDSEGRCLVTDHGSFVLFNIYGPRACSGDPVRLQFKLSFFRALQRRWEGLITQGRRVIAVGDFNISPFAVDSCDPGPDFESSLPRKWLRSMLRSGGGPFLDVFRMIHPSRKEVYTCWSQASGAEEFNYGTRIDLILAAGPCLHETLGVAGHSFGECEVEDCNILDEFKRFKPDSLPRWRGGRNRKLEGSDHAPVYVQLQKQAPLEPHEVPPLAARFMPELRGRQQSIVSLLQKRSCTSQMDGWDFSSTPKEARLNLSASTTDTSASMFVGVSSRVWSGEVDTCAKVEIDSEIGTAQNQIDEPEERMENNHLTLLQQSACTEDISIQLCRRREEYLSKEEIVMQSAALGFETQKRQQARNVSVQVQASTLSTGKKGGRKMNKKPEAQKPTQRNLRSFFVPIPAKQQERKFKAEDVRSHDPIGSLNEVLLNECRSKFASRPVIEAENHVEASQGANRSKSMKSDGSPNFVSGIVSQQNGDGRERVQEVTSNEMLRDDLGASEVNDMITGNRVFETSRKPTATAEWQRIQNMMARNVPVCHGHGEPCVGRLVKKVGPNIGRGFYVCARAQGPSANPEARCDHFEWSSSSKLRIRK